MAVKIPDVGTFVCVKWVDICSFVNADPKEVDVAECLWIVTGKHNHLSG